jgi:hypothetical protein
MPATSLLPDVKSVAGLDASGKLADIPETFEPGQNLQKATANFPFEASGISSLTLFVLRFLS